MSYVRFGFGNDVFVYNSMVPWCGRPVFERQAKGEGTVSERSIIVQGDLVPRILDGTKTQTRRPLDPQPDYVHIVSPRRRSTYFRWKNTEFANRDDLCTVCPYGQPRDVLWVREVWRICDWNPEGGMWRVQYRADGAKSEWIYCDEDQLSGEQTERLWIQCSDDMEKANILLVDDMFQMPDGQDLPTRWRSPRFMFKWASRIMLDLVDVRVEQVQEIAFQDCRAEGITLSDLPALLERDMDHGATIAMLTRNRFRFLWDMINAGRGFGWDPNPWVWVLDFARRIPRRRFGERYPRRTNSPSNSGGGTRSCLPTPARFCGGWTSGARRLPINSGTNRPRNYQTA